MTNSQERPRVPQRLPSADVFLPPLSEALNSHTESHSGVNSGGVLPWQLVYFLKPLASKVYIAIVNRRSREFVTTKVSLASGVGSISHTSLHHCLRELEGHRLIQVAHSRNEKGYVSGIRIRVLPLPRTLPEEARSAIRAELTRRRATLAAELAKLDEKLDLLNGVGRRTSPRASATESKRHGVTVVVTRPAEVLRADAYTGQPEGAADSTNA